ncbi:hypothetical protein [Ensifer sp.]|jgi:hypothetical protein|uniref:hypothetical protein n=1 Tax=Ensifer sp. TaxID=1872086 RepID=UPI002E120EEA|nr:hypothetical protein [Ensifer sp.]
MQRKEPLYRRVNSRTHGVRHGNGGDWRASRNTKAAKQDLAYIGSMHSHHRHGLDYTPLFRFLLSRVGKDWDEVYSEAIARIDRSEPIFWLVARSEEERQAYVRVGESSYYSGLYVDENKRLALVDPTLTANDMKPTCGCCTHTFNGERFTQPYDER